MENVGASLQQKIGTLPLWVWGAVVIAALYLYDKRKSATTTTATPTTPTTGTNPLDPNLPGSTTNNNYYYNETPTPVSTDPTQGNPGPNGSVPPRVYPVSPPPMQGVPIASGPALPYSTLSPQTVANIAAYSPPNYTTNVVQASGGGRKLID